MKSHEAAALLAFLLVSCCAYVTASTKITTLHSTVTSTITTLTTTITLPLPQTTTSTSTNDPPQPPASPPTATTMDSTSSNFVETILNSTNTYRTIYQVPNVTYDDALASYALAHSKACVWKHSGGPYGENLALDFDGFGAAVDAWAAEESQYNYAKAGFGEATGHFTQLVWRNTTRVGCGAVMCQVRGVEGWYLTCEYEPLGNVEGEYREMVGMRASGDGMIGLGAAVRGGGEGSRWKGLAFGMVVAAVVMLL